MHITEFFNKFSTLPKQFITDFLSVMTTDGKYNVSQKSIDLTIVAKWLGMLKHNVKRTLCENFKEHEHYTIETIYIPRKNTKAGGNTHRQNYVDP